MVRMENIRKTFHQGGREVVALDGINLEVKRGEIFGIIGLSGAGKSTLVRCVNLLERPDSGTVWVDGLEVSNLTEQELRRQRRKIGMIFQHFNLLASRTALANVAFPLEIAGVPRKQREERARQLLELVGLGGRERSYPSQLSGGQKQRVGIARALASEPKLLLCDEPTSALDPQTTRSILRLLAEINQRLGLTILLITHEMAVIKEICDRVAVIENGRILESGSVLEVFTQPQAATTQAFVSSATSAEIPPDILERPANGHGAQVLVRVTFLGRDAGEPHLSRMVRRFDVDANILYGQIDHIGRTPYGTLVVEVTGSQDAVEAALGHLAQGGLQVEVLRRVERNDVATAG
ncbi:MAG: methionine ABC transporter ATP-binding protein [Firmicutes bacterium]|nr:methionine ABC transporter ATP-binding protein [Bacillota bacterium]